MNDIMSVEEAFRAFKVYWCKSVDPSHKKECVKLVKQKPEDWHRILSIEIYDQVCNFYRDCCIHSDYQYVRARHCNDITTEFICSVKISQ